MKTFTNTEIERAHTLSAEFNALFSLAAATEHPLERGKVNEQIVGLIREGTCNEVVLLGGDILGAKIDATIVEFVDGAAKFFDDDRVFKAAENTDLVLRLVHQRSALNESPSVELAQRLRALFDEFSAAHPLPDGLNNFVDPDAGSADASEANESAEAAEESGTVQSHN